MALQPWRAGTNRTVSGNRYSVAMTASSKIFHVKLLQGIWAGMIGGTAVQMLILAAITIRCDWEKEV
jgi:hypothetical protein